MIVNSKNTARLEVTRNKSLKTRAKLDYVPWLDYVMQGDLNQDGLPDYVLVQPSGGNGLASEYCIAIFVVSSRSGYVVTKMNAMGFGPEDLLMLEPGQVSVVRSWYAWIDEPNLDGKYHSYWVHSFLKVQGSKLVFDPIRKPVWIQYTFKHNHRSTRLLSSRQKANWWKTQKEPFFVR